MFKPKLTNEKLYTISFKSASGNIVAYANLSKSFLRACSSKQEQSITASDILEITEGDLSGFLKSLTIEIEENVANNEPMNAKDY